jgi:hypothetical protein
MNQKKARAIRREIRKVVLAGGRRVTGYTERQHRRAITTSRLAHRTLAKRAFDEFHARFDMEQAAARIEAARIAAEAAAAP